MSASGGGWAQWNSDEAGNRPDPAASRRPPRQGTGPSPDLPDIQRLLFRHLAVIVAAVVLVIAGAVVTLLTSGGTAVTNSSSDTELCSSYRAAERSWDSFSTDATEISALGSVARRHSDAEVRAAGERLGNLSGVFSYGTYESIVRPIEYKC